MKFLSYTSYGEFIIFANGRRYTYYDVDEYNCRRVRSAIDRQDFKTAWKILHSFRNNYKGVPMGARDFDKGKV